MTEIKSWAVMICISLVISSVAMFIAPEGESKKIYGYIISAFVLVVILLPLNGMDFSVISDFEPEDSFDSKNEEYSILLNEYIYDSSEDIIRNDISTELDGICKDEYKISLYFEDMSSQEVNLKSILILTSKADYYSSRIIKNKVGSVTGIIPEVQMYEYQSDY